jgi:hypothetical protein
MNCVIGGGAPAEEEQHVAGMDQQNGSQTNGHFASRYDHKCNLEIHCCSEYLIFCCVFAFMAGLPSSRRAMCATGLAWYVELRHRVTLAAKLLTTLENRYAYA